MGTVPTTREEMQVALAETIHEAVQYDHTHARDMGIPWSVDRSRIDYDHYGNLHVYEFEQILAVQIKEIQICVEHGWPWWHALSEPWLCWLDDMEFVGAQGGLQYNVETGRWE